MANKFVDKLLPVLGVLLLLLLVAAAVSMLVYQRSGDSSAGMQREGLRAHAMAASMAAAAGAAARGDEQAFGRLAEIITAARGVVPPSTATDSWRNLLDNAAALANSSDAVDVVQRAAGNVNENIPLLTTQVGNLAGAAQQQAIIDEVQRFEFNVQRLQQDFMTLAAGVGDPVATVERISAADNYLVQFVRALRQGDSALGINPLAGDTADARIAGAESVLAEINSAVRDAVVSADGLQRIASQAVAVENAAAQVTRAELPDTATISVAAWLPLSLLAGALAIFLLLWMLLRRALGSQSAVREEAEQSVRNQDAILRLLDELGSLADGDLTVQATVSEDITGAIADSINYAIEALRDLVTTIDEAASQVDEAARQTRASASHLAQASENQSRQVHAATESIAAMAGSIEEVSHNAERSAEVARHSVEIAHKGGEAVRRTIDGMNTIRETIQETSKRIKRLGESSQEIGNIVELINDIAEQTNILALNASIQASMAGEAGRGFAVVADEVQRLAERSANATKQIEVLVNTIQSDTNEAVVSMERSTTDVVSGALLAENAGGALDEIEKVSNQIASLVQNISGSARTQATAAADITRNMGVLQEISSQTAEGSNATSAAIGKLAEMSTELRRSVAGFTLPDKEATVVPGVAPPQRQVASKSAAEAAS